MLHTVDLSAGIRFYQAVPGISVRASCNSYLGVPASPPSLPLVPALSPILKLFKFAEWG